MQRRGWRHHLPLIRTMSLLTILLALAAAGLSSLGQDVKDRGLDSSGWQWAPASSFGEAAPPADGWIPFDADSGLHNKTRFYWLRVPLPSQTPRDPQLWIFNTEAIRVLDGNRTIFSYDPARNGQRINLLTHWNLAPLPHPLPRAVYLLSDNRGSLRPAPWIKPVNKGDLYIALLRKDVVSFVLGALFLFTAFVAGGLFFLRRDRLQLYFSLLSLCGFYGCLVRNYVLQMFWDFPWLGYLDFAVFPLGVYAFVSIMLEVFPSSYGRFLLQLRQAILGFAVLTLIGAVVLEISEFGRLMSYPLLLLFAVTAGAIFSVLRKVYRETQGPDSVWMLSGFVLVTIFASMHVFRTYLPAVFDRIAGTFPELNRLPYDLLSMGLFFFLICLIRVILYRFGVMNEKLQHLGGFLEKNVRSRTAELEVRTNQLQESSAKLAEKSLETAEAIASSMVLEERHRITGNIHDTVGHALTATIVQLEAAKRLLDRDPPLAMEKLAASQGLIRRGLEEIRQSVRLLRDDFSQYDLTEAMSALIQETEQTTGARFEARMDPMPDSLTTLQKRVLYQALQEGITNGLRHGGSSRFRFSLTAGDLVAVFRLESDGLTYTPASYGFGLKAMSERISQLGGMMSVEPGKPGCVLLLSLPYEQPRRHAMV